MLRSSTTEKLIAICIVGYKREVRFLSLTHKIIPVFIPNLKTGVCHRSYSAVGFVMVSIYVQFVCSKTNTRCSILEETTIALASFTTIVTCVQS